MALALSVLDQSPISEGMSAADALRNSVDLAAWVEGLGYRRMWVAEHHGTPMLAGTSPELLIPLLAAATTRLRVGSGGIMLPHYSAYKVAEAFALLSSLYPGRIDLGVGRAPGSDALTAWALQRDRRSPLADDFEDQLRELVSLVRNEIPVESRLKSLRLRPHVDAGLETWLLGSSPSSAAWAAQFSLPYAFADFIAPVGAPLARGYRSTFVPRDGRESPEVAVAVWALAAETEDEARRLASSAQVAFLQFLAGQPIKVPSTDLAMHLIAHRPETLTLFAERRRAVIGAPAQVARRLTEIAQEYGADEVMVVTITYDHDARKRSYALIAEAMRSAQ